MDALPGFVSVPRLAGFPRPAGAFFSAVVEGQAGPGTWRITLDGRSQVVASDLALVPGQVLKLKLVSQNGGAWVFQVLAGPKAPGLPSSPEAGRLAEPGLVAAFVSRGLPLAAEKLALWARWVDRAAGPSDREAWAASLEARGLGPWAPEAEALAPWLAWQASLEAGNPQPPPPEDGFWDLWNSRRAQQGDPWLAMPLHWEYQGRADAGLLQAHWNPQSAQIDAWNLTAAPAGLGFRLEATPRPGALTLVWRIFDPEGAAAWASLAPGLAASLTSPGLRVDLTVAGPERGPPRLPLRGLDVQA